MSQLESKIQDLVKNKAFHLNITEKDRLKHRGSRLLNFKRAKEPMVGDFCRSIVIDKDQTKKQLILHLTYLVQDNSNVFINHLKLKGYIRDYDLKQEYSIFTYVGNFKLTSPGTEILAQIKNITIRQNKKYYELTLKYKKTELNRHISPGITQDQVEIVQRDWKIYFKYDCFSATFLAQYEEDFANPALIQRYCKDLRLREYESLSQDSLVRHLEGLSLEFQRLISEKQWTDKHYEQGLMYLKSKNPDIALEHLTLAKNFDKKSSKIYIARGCALANLNNFTEGLKQINEALKISPNNKNALQYREQIRKEMRLKEGKEHEAEPEIETMNKVRLGNNYELLRKR